MEGRVHPEPKKPPDTPSTLNEVVRLVAQLGGFLARTGDGEPGMKTIWLGMQRILDFAASFRRRGVYNEMV